MIINPKAVQAFLNRDLANSDRAKRLSDAALDRRLAALVPRPRFTTAPLWHQKICFLLGVKYGSYLYFLDPGLGKTWLALNLHKYRQRVAKRRLRLLVLVPNVANIGRKEAAGGGWGEEVFKHAPELEFLGVDESLVGEARRAAILKSRVDVVCVTYQGLAQLVTTPKRERSSSSSGRSRTAWAVNSRKFKELARTFDEVVFDESNMIQNPQSLYCRIARRLSRTARSRACLTGTPFNRDPTALWSQFYVCDGGATLGPNLGIFRAAFFIEKDNYWSRGVEYVFDRRMESALSRMIRHRSIRFAEEECLDLPKSIGGIRRPMVRSVPMSREAFGHYKRVLEDIRKAKGNVEEMKQAYTRARMLCSGYLPVRDEATGKRVDIPLPHNPKLDMLVALLREIPEHEKVIVYHEYRTTGALIAQRLAKEKIKHERLFGGTTDKIGVVSRFKRNRSLRVLVMSRSGARGHNLQVCRYMAIFESPSDPVGRVQLERRIRRHGIEHRPRYYDLQLAGSIDADILASLRNGCDLLESLIDGTAGRLRVPDGFGP